MENNKIIKRNYKVLVLQLIVTILGVIGATYAVTYFLNAANVSIGTTSLAVDYTGSLTLPSASLIPIQDSDVSSNTQNVMRVEFTVKGVNTNPTDVPIIYDISLTDLLVDGALRNPYLKWELFKNDVSISTGSFDHNFDTINQGRLVLTNIQQDLPSYNSTADSYEFVLWLSEICTTSITTCTPEQEQSYMLNKSISGKLSIDLYTKSKVAKVRQPSSPNEPKMAGGMIPVYYDEGSSVWRKADETNTSYSYKWYDYYNQKWANMVLVKDTGINTRYYYESTASAGTVIADSDILAFYVWIPRYKYRVWNINKEIGTDYYNAYTTGIDIIFESDTETTGTVNCSYAYGTPVATVGSTNETCTGFNGDYYTHPAFTLGNTQLTGIWVGKFETTCNDAGYTGTTSDYTCVTPSIRPNQMALKYQNLSLQFAQSQLFDDSTYLSGAIDAHLMKNTEWGAVAYLTHSIYGKFGNSFYTGVNKEIYQNKSDTYTTGNSNGIPSSATTNTQCTYNTLTDRGTGTGSCGGGASSTGNIYGIYDMSGGAYEYVMGNMSSNTPDIYTFDPSSSGFAASWNTGNQNYLNTYAYGTNNSTQIAYNLSILGDATGEVMLANTTSGAWYSDYSYFVNNTNSWFTRGGDISSGTYVGMFNFYQNNGSGLVNTSFRSILS